MPMPSKRHLCAMRKCPVPMCGADRIFVSRRRSFSKKRATTFERDHFKI